MKFGRNLFLLILITVIMTGCAGRMQRILPSAEPLSLVSSLNIDFADDLDVASLDLAIERSINYYEGAGHDNVYRLADRLIGARQMKESLLAFRRIIKNGFAFPEKKKQISREFDVYRAAGQDGAGSVLFTGYYVPLLAGSLTRTGKYQYPLYKTPPDLIDKKNVPYYSRREIDVEGVLQGRNLEILWVADPVELFFLHIQGSGEIKLENGTVLTVSAAGTNGRPYRSVPAYLLERGIVSGRDASNYNIKRFLKEKNEQNLYEILGYNERYIFFHLVEKPTGSLGVPVTPGRTIATDPEIFPPGALAFISLRKPVFDQKGDLTSQRISFSRFVLNQDKGAAIRGPGRVDLFCGFGQTAESEASNLKEKGELYFLIKK